VPELEKRSFDREKEERSCEVNADFDAEKRPKRRLRDVVA
jgi:hypothetical protein